MAVVTGKTAAWMEAMAAEQLVDGEINSAGHLILETRDGESKDMGSVWRPEGFPTFDGGTIDAAKLPNDYPKGVTYGVAPATGMPTTLGVVEVINYNENRATMNVYDKAQNGLVYTRRAFSNVWSPFRLLGAIPGVMEMSARSTVPYGALLCEGAAVSRTDYAELFAAIGTTFGAGDGTTTFNLPDMRGRFVAGVNSADPNFSVRGKIGGSKFHTHGLSDNAYALIAMTSGALRQARIVISSWTRAVTGPITPTLDAGSEVYATPLRGSTDDGQSLPPFISLPYIIWI